jgi:uncharacterized RDD family membrane protein YckC
MDDPYLIFALGAFFSGFILLRTAERRAKPVVSPYPKASLERRLIAFAIDFGVALAVFAVLVPRDFVIATFVGPLYFLVRDAVFGGQSFGKLFVGLKAIELETAKPVTIAGSLHRNLVLAVPGMNLVALFFEARQVRADPHGMRLGDRFAETQVVHGMGAVDLVRTVADAGRRSARALRGKGLRKRLPGSARRPASRAGSGALRSAPIA